MNLKPYVGESVGDEESLDEGELLANYGGAFIVNQEIAGLSLENFQINTQNPSLDGVGQSSRDTVRFSCYRDFVFLTLDQDAGRDFTSFNVYGQELGTTVFHYVKLKQSVTLL